MVSPRVVKFIFHSGNKAFGITQQIESCLKGLMYHIYSLARARVDEGGLKERGTQNKATLDEVKWIIKEGDLSVKDSMATCSRLGIPNWVVNSTIEFAKKNDLREHYLDEFFVQHLK